MAEGDHKDTPCADGTVRSILFEKNIQEEILYASWTITLLMAIVLGITSYIVFCKRRPEQRPSYIKIQIYLGNGFCLFWIVYFSIVYYATETQYGSIESWEFALNFLASIADTMMIIYDWLFFRQFILAGFLLPVELNIQLDKDAHDKEKAAAYKKRNIIEISFYVVLAIWFGISIWQNRTWVRLSICIL